MKYVMIDEYRAVEHNVYNRVINHRIYTQYHPSAQMAGPIGVAPNRWVRAVPETDPLYTYLILKEVGWVKEI